MFEKAKLSQLLKLLNEEDLEILQLLRKNYHIDKSSQCFILAWFILCNHETFGFQDVVGLEEQLDEAIRFAQYIQVEWQRKVQNNETSLTFLDYFYANAVSEGILLPTDFISKFEEMGL